jgi:hypothetical protein
MVMSEKDALLRKLAELVKWPEEKLDRMISLLEDIKAALTAAPPVAGAVTIANLDEVRDTIVEALETYGALRMANDLYVYTLDLSTERATPKEIPELADSISLTLFRCDGTFTIYLQSATETRKFTFDAITYPQTFLLDNFKIVHVYVTNTAQAGKSAIIIAWKRV